MCEQNRLPLTIDRESWEPLGPASAKSAIKYSTEEREGPSTEAEEASGEQIISVWRGARGKLPPRWREAPAPGKREDGRAETWGSCYTSARAYAELACYFTADIHKQKGRELLAGICFSRSWTDWKNLRGYTTMIYDGEEEMLTHSPWMKEPKQKKIKRDDQRCTPSLRHLAYIFHGSCVLPGQRAFFFSF